jgi:glycosyltransferase involved in cell wall biosynthesis
MSRDRYRSNIQHCYMHDAYVVVDPAPDTLKCGRVDLENPLKVSFCIPTLNSEKMISRCLKSIINQDYPNVEIVIVDGGSSDSTVDVVREFTDKVFFDKGTLGSARQTATDHAVGEVLAIFDDDIVIPHRGWLRNVIQYFNYSENVSTVWPMVVAPPDAALTTRLYNNIHKNKVQDHVSKKRGYWGGGNSLFWRQYMEDIGGIDRSLRWGEDYDWAKRFKDAGYQVILTYDVLYHNTMTSLREFAKKQFIGADTFLRNNFATTGLSTNEVFYEQFVAGAKGMARGLFKERDYSWMLYPLFLTVRIIVFGSAYLKVLWQKAAGAFNRQD